MLSLVVKIVKLTVSAGDNKVIQYPENSVKLQAFALPAPTNGNVYIWLETSWLLITMEIIFVIDFGC